MSDINNNIAAAGQRANSALTFGAELEFVAIVPKKIIMQYSSAQQYLCSYLMNTRVKVPCHQPGCREKEHMFYLPMNGDEDSEQYDRWVLTTDTTVNSDRGNITSELAGYECEGLELISRVQKFEGTSRCPTGQIYPCTQKPLEWSWRVEFKAFLDLLHEAFTGAGFSAFVNETTGFHVHLGHGDKGLPFEVAQGLLGTMTAFERSFDQLLTADRISGPVTMRLPGLWSLKQFNPLPGINVEGFHALYKPGVVQEEDFHNQWCPAISNVMFQCIHSQIYHTATQTDPRRALTTSPTVAAATAGSVALSAETAKSVEQYLSSFNVPGWLNIIKGNTSIQQLKNMFYTDKYTALSLRGLGENNNSGPPTAEVRTHAGSLDFAEISAWLDLLTSLSHWVESTPQEKVFSYLEESWRDVDYNICRLARDVGASDSTVQHYGVVLGDGYAQWRCDNYTSPSLTFTDKLENLNRITEEKRRKDFSRESVDEKIRWKLESGRYGQLPTSFLKAQPEPEIFSRPEAKCLHLSEDGQKAWIKFLKDYYRVERKLDLTSKNYVDASDASSDASPDASPDSGVNTDSASDSESVAAGADDEESESDSDDDSDGSDDSDKKIRPPKAPVEELEYDDLDGFYGIHPALAGAYNQIPGQHLTHLEQTVISMPALPSPTSPNMAAFDELKTDTVARIHEALLNPAMITSLAAADTQAEVVNMIARAVEGTKQLHVLNSCVTEKASAQRYLNKKVT
ncbi:hypothetical protein E4T50_03677 [Aureobasidium sp. EXF-12298]|nr:hypothetical protein E4T50_03677 [Aureobasidium sp. EXF-12298]